MLTRLLFLDLEAPIHMRNILLSLAVSTMIVLSSAAQQSAQPSGASGGAANPHFDGSSWWNYVKVLASDDMEGRETGSPALRHAEEYVVEQLQEMSFTAISRDNPQIARVSESDVGLG